MAWVYIVMALISAYASYEGGRQQQKLANYNASLAERAAARAKKKAALEAQLQRRRNQQVLGRHRAVAAASGVESTTGTPLLVQLDTATESELDALAIKYGGDVEAAKLRSEASMERFRGKIAYKQGQLNAGVSLLQGVGRAYGN